MLLFVYVVAATWLACQLFAGRAAFLLVGAMLATAMSANVLFWIIPGQRKVIAQMRAGQPVDPVHGQRAKQRSLHNTYFTLPVLVSMVSNHYGWLYQSRHNWLVLVALMLAGGAGAPLVRGAPQGAGAAATRALGLCGGRGRVDARRRWGHDAGGARRHGRCAAGHAGRRADDRRAALRDVPQRAGAAEKRRAAQPMR